MRAPCARNNEPGLPKSGAGTRRDTDQREPPVRRLLKVAGTTYAAEAGIKINDKPMMLFQLLVLCMLASKPIDATTAMVLASDRRTIIARPAAALARASLDDDVRRQVAG
jgi:hypothetical protein